MESVVTVSLCRVPELQTGTELTKIQPKAVGTIWVALLVQDTVCACFSDSSGPI